MSSEGTAVLTVGNGLYFTKPGTSEELHCSVCGRPCNVEHNVKGYASYVAAVADWPTLKDKFTCPCVGEPAHTLAYHLQRRLTSGEVGVREEQMLRADLRDALDSLS